MDRGGTSNEKKRKVERAFQDKWSVQYFFIEKAESKIPVCLICNESVSVAKEYNIKDTMKQSTLLVFTAN